MATSEKFIMLEAMTPYSLDLANLTKINYMK